MLVCSSETSQIIGSKAVGKARAKSKVAAPQPDVVLSSELPDKLDETESSKLFRIKDSFGAALDSKIEFPAEQ